jgi:hypothetical protein
MAYYLVRAKPREDRLADLRQRIDSGEIRGMRPFGTAMDYSLRHARLEANGTAVWEEEDYCTPPLAMERQAVLNDYFDGLEVETVTEGKGWQAIDGLPGLWKEKDIHVAE